MINNSKIKIKMRNYLNESGEWNVDHLSTATNKIIIYDDECEKLNGRN